MKTVQVLDRKFELFLSAETIAKRVEEIAQQLNTELAGENPLFLPILNGSFMFASDLMKHITIPSELTFVKVASYDGMNTTGNVTTLIGMSEDLADRTVVIIEDIIDSGVTMKGILESMQSKNLKKVVVVSLFSKPEALTVELPIDYVGFEIPNRFIVGYGLDYDGQGRNLPEIYSVL